LLLLIKTVKASAPAKAKTLKAALFI